MASELYVETLKGLTSGANANKVIIPSGQTLDIAGDWTPPAGTVLQVLHDIATTQVAISEAAGADTGLSVTITPSSSSSKFYIVTDINARLNTNVGIGIEIKRSTDGGSTFSNVLQSLQDYDMYAADNPNLRVRGSWSYLDSPATTSNVIYKIRARSYAGGGGTLYINNSGQSMLTVMEIAG